MLKRPGGDREMVDVLSLVLHYDEQKVEQAIHLALRSDHVSKQHVINSLMRLLEEPKPAPMDTPPVLRLVDEPKANTHRYDHLREKPYAS